MNCYCPKCGKFLKKVFGECKSHGKQDISYGNNWEHGDFIREDDF